MKVHRVGAPRNLDCLRILAFSDCRVQHIPDLLTWLDAQQARPDLILYAGDDCRRFRPDGATNYFESLASRATFGLAAVIGNDDVVESRSLISGERVFEVHSRPLQVGPFIIVGIEGSPLPSSPQDGPPIGFTLHSEERISHHLRNAISLAKSAHLLVLSHTPPRGSLDLAIRFGRREIGSVALAAALRSEAAPEVVVCGHVHSQGGRSELSGQSRVINVASHDFVGAFLVVAQFTWSAHEHPTSPLFPIDWVHLPVLGGLLAISGIGPRYAERLVRDGISTMEELASSAPDAVGLALGRSPASAMLYILRAKAALENQPILIRRIPSPLPPRLFVDIETDPDFGSRYIWLVGVFDEASGEFCQFLAPNPSHEHELLSSFAAYCDRTSCASLVSYSGSNFDTNRLLARMAANNIDPPRIVSEGSDLIHGLRYSVAFPIRSYALKQVAACLGYTFVHPELDGFTVALAYERAVAEDRPVPNELLEYNADDVMSLVHTLRTLEALWDELP